MAVVLAARRRERLERLADDIRQAGGRAHPVEADVASDEDAQRMVDEAVRVFGKLDTAICNAGVGYHATLEETPPAAMARLMDINFMGTFLVARAALPHLKQQPNARLIFVSSILGKRGLARSGAYVATKFAQVGLAESLRAELASTTVRVIVVLPVSTDTELREAMAREQGFEVGGLGPRQSAENVADAILRAIERPRAEVYPYRRARLLAIASAAAPGLMDRFVRRFTRRRN
jgi:short-subunit dehydrogenase